TGLGARREAEWVRLGEAGVRIADHAFPPHDLDDRVAPLHGAVRKLARVVALGGAREPGQRRRLREVQVLRGFSEVLLRGRLDTVGAVAEVDLVEIQLEDAILRVSRFDAARDLDLLQLAGEATHAGALAPIDALRKD